MKKNKQLLVAALGLFLASCGTGGAKKTPGGVDFVVHKSGSGAQLKLGDTVLLNIIQSLNDSVLVESRKMAGGPVPFVISKSVNKYDLMDGLAMLKEGDSATFSIPIDSLPEPHPPFGKKGDKLNVTFIVVGKYAAAAQKEKDEKVIKEYMDKNKITATATPEGVYVSVKEEGTGAQPKAGDTVYVHYTGKLLDGKVFDSSLDSTLRPGMKIEPIKFPIGRGFVIKGWDAGIAALKKGSKATLIIPSTLAYGLQGSPPAIPGNSVLAFDVQLVDVKAGGPEAPAAPAALQPGKK